MDKLGSILQEIMELIKIIGIVGGLLVSLGFGIYVLTHWREVVYNECIPHWEKEERKAERKRQKAEKKRREEAKRWWTA